MNADNFWNTRVNFETACMQSPIMTQASRHMCVVLRSQRDNQFQPIADVPAKSP